ncbi:MAG: tetratricopeptide repeat protein [Woeseiaceae bacterium]|nr:tetratricopeptide repeat protein [Woeseiaceae bacterium]
MKSPLVEALRNATEEAADRHADGPVSPSQEHASDAGPEDDGNQPFDAESLELMQTSALQRQEDEDPEAAPEADYAATRSLEIDDDDAANEPGDSLLEDLAQVAPGPLSTRMPRHVLYAPLLCLGVGLAAAAGHYAYHWIIDAEHDADLAVLSDRDRGALASSTDPLPEQVGNPFRMLPATPGPRAGQAAPDRDAAASRPAPAPQAAPPVTTSQAAPLRTDVGDPAFAVLAEAFSAFQAGDIAAAESAYRAALEIAPRHPNALQSLAAILFATNRQDEAMRLYDELLSVEPENSAAAAALLSVDDDAGVSGVKHLIQRHPGSGQLRFALGVQYAEQSRWPEAHVAFAEALQIEPGNPEYLFNLAVTLEHLQRYDEARGAYGLTLARADSGTYLDRAVIARRIDQLDALSAEPGAGR